VETLNPAQSISLAWWDFAEALWLLGLVASHVRAITALGISISCDWCFCLHLWWRL